MHPTLIFCRGVTYTATHSGPIQNGFLKVSDNLIEDSNTLEQRGVDDPLWHLNSPLGTQSFKAGHPSLSLLMD
jgi:hypothetical protein